MYVMDRTGANLVDLQAQADEERTKRSFIGFLSSALGVDQNYATDDMYASNRVGQYRIANPDGTVSALGRSSSNVQSTGLMVGGTLFPASTLMVLAALDYFVLKR